MITQKFIDNMVKPGQIGKDHPRFTHGLTTHPNYHNVKQRILQRGVKWGPLPVQLKKELLDTYIPVR